MLRSMGRQILHVDMDEFFAAVEKLDNPALVGKCVLVGGDPAGRGVVSTASYEARAFGCGSAMPMVTALRLCPKAIVLPGRHERYREVSEQVFEIFGRFSPLVEPLSIDEAFLDVTGSLRLMGDGEQIARGIKGAIRREVGLTASVGVAPNKFLAKLASELDKPDGLTVITAENVLQVLDPLPIRKLWGVGPAAEKRLERLNIRTFGQFRRAAPATLTAGLGPGGQDLQRLARGEDDRPVVPDHQARSISQECTFARDVDDYDQLGDVLVEQVSQVARRLRRAQLKARTVTLKIRTGDFVTRTRSATLGEATNLTDELLAEARGLLVAWRTESPAALRLLGMGASQLLAAGGQLPLFGRQQRDKMERLDRTLDDIASRFGSQAVRRGKVKGADPAAQDESPDGERKK